MHGRRPVRSRIVAEPPLVDGLIDGEPDQESVARTIALRLLAAAPRTRVQLADAMAARAVPGPVAERVLDRFEEIGYVNDADYADMFVRNRRGRRGLSRAAIRCELAARGVGNEVIDAAVGAITDDDEEATALEVARKALRASAGCSREVRLRRGFAAVARKGFSTALANRVVLAELDASVGESADECREGPEPAERSAGARRAFGWRLSDS